MTIRSLRAWLRLVWYAARHPFKWTTWWMVWSRMTTKRTWLYLLVRWLQGARIPITGETGGCIYEDGIDIEFGGACPVQGDGTIDGFGCYYRSRGEGWSFEVFRGEDYDTSEQTVFEYGERAYYWPDGGYVGAAESERNIRRAVGLFRSNVREGAMVAA